MADEKKFTQAEVDDLIRTHAASAKEANEEARTEGLAEGIARCSDWLEGRADQLEAADADRGFFEAEITILRWAAKRVGAL